MKHILPLLMFVSSLLAESPEIKITAAQPAYAGYRFTVVAEPLSSSSKGSEIQCIAIAIMPPANSSPMAKGYIVVSKEQGFVYSSTLAVCSPEDLPISLRRQVPRCALLFTFMVHSAAIPESYFSYRLPRPADGFDPAACIVRLSDFIKNTQP